MSHEPDRASHERIGCQNTMARLLEKHGPANDRWLKREARRRYRERMAEAQAA